jgi:2-dehydro-3-deoxyphosphooctonate aldolase (KDO 8-P synthase)
MVGNDLPLALIAGPCQIESLDHALRSAAFLAGTCEAKKIPFVYKSSFDKANRTSGDTPRGPGEVEGLRILEEVKRQLGVLVTTDVHTEEQAYTASMVVDLVQVPALLSRQTDIIKAAGAHARAVSIKKLQMASPPHWAHRAVQKARNPNTILIERGTAFGYGLVNDFTAWPAMRQYAPVFFDATHSVQSPSSLGASSGGNRALVPDLAAAAVAVGIAGVFLECHEDPDFAPSDGPCMMRMDDMPALLNRLKRIDEVAKSYPA